MINEIFSHKQMILFVSLQSALKQKTILKVQFGLGHLSGFLIYIFLSSSLVNVLSLSLSSGTEV